MNLLFKFVVLFSFFSIGGLSVMAQDNVNCRAVVVEKADPPILRLGETDKPIPKAGEVLVKVHAVGVNRADVEQSRGLYPAPKGASPILGLELSGEVVALGPEVKRFKVGDRIMSLVQGGAYSEYAAAPEATSFLLPDSLSYVAAAAIPESYFTVWLNVVVKGRLQAGQTLLVQGGSSGVGSAAVQIGKALGAKVIATARTDEKCEAVRALGADLCINYRTTPFEKEALAFTGGEGVDVVLDLVGKDYLARHFECLKRDGRLVLIDSRSGDFAEIDLGAVMDKGIVLTGSLLRPRPLEEKRELRDAIERILLPRLASREIVPLVYREIPWDQAAEAHRIMERGEHIGKIVLVVE